MLELASVLILGIAAQWIAWRMRIPAIFPLILIGLIAGPVWELVYGYKQIDPDHLFAGKTMYYFVALSVGVILFEGGITLKFKEVAHLARTIRNLLIFGTIIMLLGGAVASHFIVNLNWRIALLFGSLIIVTGPTVIAPIIQSVRPNKNVAAVLKWEGILIDPIGALAAVLMFELLFATAAAGHTVGEDITEIAFQTFALNVAVGSMIGLFTGWVMRWLLIHKQIPEFLINVIALTFVVLAFATADTLKKESGLMAVTVMGIFLANTKTPKIEKILDFKESLTVILISVLFIILASHIDGGQLTSLGWPAVGLLLVVMLVLRPLAVFISAWKSNLSFKEKIFLSWVGPKGIVAAAVASLFSLNLIDFIEQGNLDDKYLEQARMIVPLTFLIILGTVTLSGLSAKYVARWLGVVRRDSNGFIIVGAHESAVAIAKYLVKQRIPVTLVDTSRRNVHNAIGRHLHAIEGNILSEEITEEVFTEDAGYLLSLTASHDINILACNRFEKIFGKGRVFRLITVSEMKFSTMTRPKTILFGGDADFIKMTEIVRKYPEVSEMPLSDKGHLMRILENEEDELIPLFIKSKAGKFTVINARYDVKFDEGDQLVYMGRASKDLLWEKENSSNSPS